MRSASLMLACYLTDPTRAFVATAAGQQYSASRCASSVRLAATNLFDNCPLLGGCPFGTDAPPAPPSTAPPVPKERESPLEVATQAAEQLERSILGATAQPFACAASEAIVETVVCAACEELGSCDVTVESASSARLLRGELDRARIRASGVSASGLRFSSAELEAEVSRAASTARQPVAWVLRLSTLSDYPSLPCHSHPRSLAIRSPSSSTRATPSPPLRASQTLRRRRRRDSAFG